MQQTESIHSEENNVVLLLNIYVELCRHTFVLKQEGERFCQFLNQFEIQCGLHKTVFHYLLNPKS